MTRTSKALKRLGIAGLAVVTIGAGVPALIASTAQAAGPVTSVTYNSTSNKAGAAGTCLNYSVHAADAAAAPVANATITVTVSTSTPNADVQFCTQAQTGFGDNTVANQPAPSPGSPVGTQGGPVPAGGGTSTDVATFRTDVNGNVTFGLVSTLNGTTATFTPFVDNNANGTVDPTDVAGPQGTANWGPGGPAGSTAAQNAVTGLAVDRGTDAAVVSESRSFTLTATGVNGAQPGVQVSYIVTGAETKGPTACATLTDNNGQTRCSVTFTVVGNDTVRFFVNQTNNVAGNTPTFDAGEPTATVAETVTAAPTAGSLAVSVACLADAGNGLDTQTPCVNEVNDTNRSFRAVVDNSSSTSTNLTPGTRLSFAVTGGSGDETVTNSGNAGNFAGQAPAGTQPNECVTVDYNGTSAPAPTDPSASTTNSYCDVIVNDPTPVSGEVLTLTATVRGTTTSGSATLAFRNAPSDARNISISPKTATTAPNSARTFTATVVDSLGKAVQGVAVTFTESGAGAFRNGSSTVNGTTDANGQASVEVISLPGETGSETITVSIDTPAGTQCQKTSGATPATAGNTPTGGPVPAGQTAGNCTDSATNTFATASPSPSTSPSAGGTPTLATSTPDIQPNQRGLYQATNLTAGVTYELRCYSRPSTTYFTARSITASTSTLEYGILPGTNTRCYVRPAGDETKASNSVVINVHTTLSLSAVRTGVRTYVFQGRNLPRRSGQLITLYRLSGGQEIRTSNLVTDASGIFRVTRKFTGTGTFQFRVRTSQNLTNAAGASVAITVTVH
jgi:hypothetical protein